MRSLRQILRNASHRGATSSNDRAALTGGCQEENDSFESFSRKAAECTRSGDLRSAISHYELAGAAAIDCKNPLTIVASLNNLGGAYATAGDPRAAALQFTSAAQISHACSDTFGEAMSLNNLAGVKRLTSAAEAAALFERASSLFERCGQRLWMATAIVNAASCHGRSGNSEQAKSLLMRVRDTAAVAHDSEHKAAVLINAGLVSSELGEPAAASEYYETAVEVASRIVNDNLHATALANLAAIRVAQKRMWQAANNLREAKRLFGGSNNTRGQAMCLSGLGNLYLLSGERRRASEYFSAAELLFHACGDFEAERLARNASMRCDFGRMVQ